MIPADQNEQWKRVAMKHFPAQVCFEPYGTDDKSFEQSLSSFSHSGNSCPKHSVQYYPNFNNLDYMPSEMNEQRNTEFHDHIYGARNWMSSNYIHYSDMSSMNMATLQLHHLIRQREMLGSVGALFDSVLSPPPTESSSRSTQFSCNSAPPFVTHCPSPVSSEDFDRQYGSFDSLSNSNYNINNAVKNESTDGYYKNDGKNYERSTMYTAEDVHTVVKSHRDGKKQRMVSNKVFVGGISHSMNREIINTFFGKFGPVFVDWPVKQKSNIRGKMTPVSSYSYLFLVYSEEHSVIKLMNACKKSGTEYFVSVPGCRETIQIRPWFIQNAFYISSKARHSRIVDVHRTVFVGGLPRIVTAEEIAKIFSEFGKVLLVTIDIDQDYGYPKGAARVTFERDSSFNRALERKYIKFENIDSSKTLIEIKPYVMEDVGCDQCGGLWFNPFLDAYDQLASCRKDLNRPETPTYNMWSSNHPLSPFDTKESLVDNEDLISKMDAEHQRNAKSSFHSNSLDSHEEDKTENELETGARKFLEMAKSFGLDKEQTVKVDGVEFRVGPELWYHFLPKPSFEIGKEPVQMDLEQKIISFLRMKRTNVYSNKSSYCKERPCRQYYCPSCSNKLHSGPDQHVLLPAGKPERRPRKDKNMYLVSLNN